MAGQAFTMADALGLSDGSLYMPPPERRAAETTADMESLLAPLPQMPDVTTYGLPASTLIRMHARRDWLRSLHEIELERARRVADGERSMFEAACGMEPPEALSAESAHKDLRAIRSKFESEMTDLIRVENMEIEVLDNLGMCRSRAVA